MNELERFHACMQYRSAARPCWNWGGWPETVEKWRKEGYDPERHDPASVCDRRLWFGSWFHPNPPFERRVIEEDADTVVYINHEGILMREMKGHNQSSMPQFLKFPVENRDDFHRFWQERMQPDLDIRIGPGWRQVLREQREKPVPLIVAADRWGGFFGPLRNLVGVEGLCLLMHDDPEFVEEMMDADADFIIDIMAQVLSVIEIDAFAFWEDMAFNHAPLISPEMVRRYMLPRYSRVAEFLRSHGVNYIGLDSDGWIDPLIPVWLEAGLNFLYPFEVQAGMDVMQVRKKYGRTLRIWGGVDKRALAKGRGAIDAELRRIKPLIGDGGYIPHLDHSCPPDIAYADYCYYLEKLSALCRESALPGTREISG